MPPSEPREPTDPTLPVESLGDGETSAENPVVDQLEMAVEQLPDWLEPESRKQATEKLAVMLLAHHEAFNAAMAGELDTIGNYGQDSQLGFTLTDLPDRVQSDKEALQDWIDGRVEAHQIDVSPADIPRNAALADFPGVETIIEIAIKNRRVHEVNPSHGAEALEKLAAEGWQVPVDAERDQSFYVFVVPKKYIHMGGKSLAELAELHELVTEAGFRLADLPDLFGVALGTELQGDDQALPGSLKALRIPESPHDTKSVVATYEFYGEQKIDITTETLNDNGEVNMQDCLLVRGPANLSPEQLSKLERVRGTSKLIRVGGMSLSRQTDYSQA